MGNKLFCTCCDNPESRQTSTKINLVFNSQEALSSCTHSEVDILPLPTPSEKSFNFLEESKKHSSCTSETIQSSKTAPNQSSRIRPASISSVKKTNPSESISSFSRNTKSISPSPLVKKFSPNIQLNIAKKRVLAINTFRKTANKK
ncbi:hypothetical protein SteCoe_24322 [Stentor coeruleus]|uniref:Uncharacterized protein n=1 Tax=Stentor coeruleus TaxID=5963 RepID=A0A1R2BHT0_9CILI|nr:hypothetical protein SteCoe_24322 [Stentor coeruleus]